MATSIAPNSTSNQEESIINVRSLYVEALYKLVKSPIAILTLGILLLLLLGAIFAPFLTPYHPNEGNVSQRLLPIFSPGYVLGTDEQGRDMLTRILYGGRLSILVGLAPVIFSTLFGLMIGSIAGYSRGIVGNILMRAMDMSYAFPVVILAIGITSALGPGVNNIIIAITLVFIPRIARIAEASTKEIVIKEFMEAAKISGASDPQMIFTQLLPNIIGSVFIYSSGLFGVSIVLGSGLSFLGLGASPPTAEWGYMLSSLRGSLYIQPLVVILPGLLIFITSIAFNFLSDEIHDALEMDSH
jgi:peptide/nickel transport system permease protein